MLSDTGRTDSLWMVGNPPRVITAHLSNALDDRYHVLERLHGSEGARLAAASHGSAIDKIESIARQERISCDFERLDGYLFLAPGESPGILDAELEADITFPDPVGAKAGRSLEGRWLVGQLAYEAEAVQIWRTDSTGSGVARSVGQSAGAN